VRAGEASREGASGGGQGRRPDLSLASSGERDGGGRGRGRAWMGREEPRKGLREDMS
jgi:hypothetical protein